MTKPQENPMREVCKNRTWICLSSNFKNWLLRLKRMGKVSNMIRLEKWLKKITIMIPYKKKEKH